MSYKKAPIEFFSHELYKGASLDAFVAYQKDVSDFWFAPRAILQG